MGVFDLASSWTLPICPSWVGHQSGSGLCALSAEGACYVPGTDTASGLAAWKETHTELPTQCVNTTIFPEYQCPYPGVDVKCKFPMLPLSFLGGTGVWQWTLRSFARRRLLRATNGERERLGGVEGHPRGASDTVPRSVSAVGLHVPLSGD